MLLLPESQLLVAQIRNSLLQVALEIFNLLWSSAMRQTSVRIEIDLPAPFLEFGGCCLAPLVLDDWIGVSMAHELNFRVSTSQFYWKPV